MPDWNTIATMDGVEWLGVWLDVAVRGALLLAVTTLLVRVLRRTSAATRHVVWSAAVAALVALPLLTWTLPSWRKTGCWAPLDCWAHYCCASLCFALSATRRKTLHLQPASLQCTRRMNTQAGGTSREYIHWPSRRTRARLAL